MHLAHCFAALFALSSVAVGCSVTPVDGDDDILTEEDAGTIPDDMDPACTGTTLEYCAGFHPATAVDFVGFRTERTTPRPATGDGGAPGGIEAAWTATLGTDRVGTPCSGATDQAACEDRFAKLRVLGDSCQGVPIVPLDVAGGAAAPQQSGTCSTTYLVYTRGDAVEVITNAAQAIAFFGAIDSLQEALYLAYLSGESLQCTGSSPVLYAEKDDGYDILTSTSSRCGGSLVRKRIHVSSAGVITVVPSTGSGETCGSSH